MISASRSEAGRAEALPGPVPADFYWGCGTSPTQIEGQTVNEWAPFVSRDGRRADDGPDHWRRWREDFGLLDGLGANAYRIGLDWGRLQPAAQAPLDPAVLDHYTAMLADLRRRGIEPFLTLFHFACPTWLAAQGGWLHPQAPAYFDDFVGRLLRALPPIRYWITFNEPAVHVFMAYALGEFPPCRRRRFDLALRALHRQRDAHRRVFARLKAADGAHQIGITKHVKYFSPLYPWHPLHRLTARLAKGLFDRWGLDPFLRAGAQKTADFLGINFYGRMRMCCFNGVSPLTGFPPEMLEQHGMACDDMWEQDPDRLVDCLSEAAGRTGLPLFITENGVATRDEDLRCRYLVEHVRNVQTALAQGIDLRGYFYWSLIDNYEWGEGLSKRFGLIGVDFDHPRRPRQPRPAAALYHRIAEAGGVPYERRAARKSGSSCEPTPA